MRLLSILCSVVYRNGCGITKTSSYDYDFDDYEIMDMLLDATSKLDADIERLVLTRRDTNFGRHIMNILAHNIGFKKLSSNVSRICSDREIERTFLLILGKTSRRSA